MSTSAGKNIILVTGGNGGIGFETVSQLLEAPSNHVILGSRSISKGEDAVKQLQARNHPGSLELLELDVSAADSVNAAAKKVESKHGKLNVLINNAAIASFPDGTPYDEQMAQSYRTNVIGPWLTCTAFAPLLKAGSPTSRIVNVTSGAGSIGLKSNPDHFMRKLGFPHYRASKSALNMLTACQVVDFEESGVKVFAVCPGFTVSNLGPQNNAQSGAKPTAEGAKAVVQVANGERDDEAGKFLHIDGVYPW